MTTCQTAAASNLLRGRPRWLDAGTAPEGSTETNNWIRTQKAFEEGAATTTEDTVFTGFGAEGLTTAEMRRDFVARAMAHLLD